MRDMKTKLLSMGTGGEFAIDDETTVLRVVGGWIYKFYGYDVEKSEDWTLISTCFVPHSNK